MTTEHNPDPVNRWATEHYGFEDEPVAQDAAAAGSPIPASSPAVARPWADEVPGRGRRTSLIAAAGVLSLALVAGIGGFAVAEDGGPGSGPGGGAGGGRDRIALRFDGDGGGRTGNLGTGRR
jgi:hypothetical protein